MSAASNARLLAGLVENETLKVLKRRRWRVVLLLLLVILSVVVWGQSRQRAARARENPTADWRAATERRAADLERRLGRGNVPDGFARWMKFESARLRYHLSINLNPDEISGPAFSRGFASVGSVLLLPLLVAIFASDIVSSEFQEGTVKLLLTRPVARWKVLLSKFLAMGLFTTLTIAAAAVLSWAVAGLAFGWRGWDAPMLNGFRAGAQGFDASAVRLLPLWQDALAAWGLAWWAAICVGSLTVLLSVVLRQAAAAMGTMMGTLVAGTILSRLASDWDAARWLFVTNLPLPDFWSGLPPPFPGMTLGFSAAVLGAWGLAGAAGAFALFARRDVKA